MPRIILCAEPRSLEIAPEYADPGTIGAKSLRPPVGLHQAAA